MMMNNNDVKMYSLECPSRVNGGPLGDPLPG